MLSLHEVDGDGMFTIVRESKVALELITIDLDIDAALSRTQHPAVKTVAAVRCKDGNWEDTIAASPW
ncbi:MAG: hypothetical protein OHK0047_36930 [Leptolyngbyaceae cyanobacterium]